GWRARTINSYWFAGNAGTEADGCDAGGRMRTCGCRNVAPGEAPCNGPVLYREACNSSVRRPNGRRRIKPEAIGDSPARCYSAIVFTTLEVGRVSLPPGTCTTLRTCSS